MLMGTDWKRPDVFTALAEDLIQVGLSSSVPSLLTNC